MSNQIKILIGILVVVVLIVGSLILKKYQPAGDILIQTDKTEYQSGDNLKIKIKNNFGKKISFSSCYPYYLEKKNENWENYQYAECSSFNGNWHYIETGNEKAFEIILPQIPDGLHRLAVPICIGCENKDSFKEDKRFYSNEFLVKQLYEITKKVRKYENLYFRYIFRTFVNIS